MKCQECGKQNAELRCIECGSYICRECEELNEGVCECKRCYTTIFPLDKYNELIGDGK